MAEYIIKNAVVRDPFNDLLADVTVCVEVPEGVQVDEEIVDKITVNAAEWVVDTAVVGDE